MDAYNKIVKYANNLYPFAGDITRLIDHCKKMGIEDNLYFQKVHQGGFCALENALRFYTLNKAFGVHDLFIWNFPHTWKKMFSSIIQEPFWCFGEDVFANQYIFYHSKICIFECETGNIIELCNTFEEWLNLIISSPDYYSGYSVSQQWQRKNPQEPINSQYNLSAIIPFVCRGEYTAENVFRIDSLKNMELKANFANQIQGLPEGTHIKFKFTP